MERTRYDSWRIAMSLAAAFALTTAIVWPRLVQADEPPPGVILLADASKDTLELSAAKEKKDIAVQPRTPEGSLPSHGQLPVWVPRVRQGAPASRVGGATRGRDKTVTIQTLVPEVDEAALTLAAQPQLYWHLSSETTHVVNFTLLDPSAADPMIDEMIEGPFAAGVQVLSLTDYEIQLEPGRKYEWFVAVVPDPENRSADTVARGAIVRVKDPELASQVASSEPDAAVELLARSGIWYEALDVVSRSMRERPEDKRPLQVRDTMLQQVGLALSDDS